MKLRAILLAFAIFFLTIPLHAADPLLAPTPPMGWNSWDSYGQTVTEGEIRANAKWMAKHLKRFGWQYVVVDEGWYILNPGADPQAFHLALTDDGRFIPAPARFPSTSDAAGFKPLADYIHSLGLKFGIHIIRGIPRDAVAKNLPIAASSFHAEEAADKADVCPWNSYNYGVKDNAAGQAYYNSIARLYADWGVDFVKVDCIADHPYKPDEIRMLRAALDKTGRPIVLSLSPGPTERDKGDYIAKHAEMWRISNDVWDHWGPWEGHTWSQGLLAQFGTAAQWADFYVPGHWPDADMLPLGHFGPNAGEGEVRDTKFTRDEQITLMSLWSVFRSPLMMGGYLPSMDKWTTSLLTNPEVIALDQHSRDNHPVVSTEKAIVWTARPESGDDYYVAVFNVSEAEQALHYEWKDLGLANGNYHLRDLWGGSNKRKAASLDVTLRPHASALYRVAAVK